MRAISGQAPDLKRPPTLVSSRGQCQGRGRKKPHLKEHRLQFDHRARNRRITHRKFKKVNSYRDAAGEPGAGRSDLS